MKLTVKPISHRGNIPEPMCYKKLLHTMRITTVILFMACLQASALEGNPQITLSAKGTSLENIFKSIRKQTGYKFFYNYDWMQNTKPVTINVKNATLEHVLTLCMKDQPLTYAIVDNTVILKQKEAPPGLASPSNIDDPPITIKGKVTNEKGEAADGVTVTVKGSKRAVSTNSSGDFSFEGVERDAVLVFSGVGFEEYEVRVGGKREVNVVMRMKMKEMEEVMVSTGYQEVDKTRATGSFVKVDNELLNRSVSTNVLDRIFNVTSGLNYQPTKIENPYTIRGLSTINANPRPLIVVDGFPYDESSTNVNSIANINPNDIESITILKDAAAASIWGARAGNGVIVIVTKKGKYNQRTSVQINSNVTVNNNPDLEYIPTLSSSDQIEVEQMLFNKGFFDIYDTYAAINYFINPLPAAVELLLSKRKAEISETELNTEIANLKQQDIRNELYKYLIKKATVQQYSLNIKGGGDKITYYGSIGYDKTYSVNVGNNFDRLTIRLDNTYNPFKKVELRGTFNYSYSKNINNGFDYYSFIPKGNRISPYTRLYNGNSSAAIPKDYRLPYVDTASFPALLDWHYRPLDELKYSDNFSKLQDIRVGAEMKYLFTPGINLEIKYQYQNTAINSENLYDTQTYYARNLINKYTSFSRNNGKLSYPIPLGAILANSNSSINQWNFRGQFNFNREWLNNQLNSLVGLETRETNSNGAGVKFYGYDKETAIYSSNINYDSSYVLNPKYNGESRIPSNSSFTPSTLQRYLNYFANTAYTYRNAYTASASVRFDGSNFFGIKANQKIIPLWSVGFLWNISKEGFYEAFSTLPNIKFRATYGYNGNMYNNVGAYTSIRYSNPASYSLIQTPYANITTPPNPELRWEKVKMLNIGLDYETRDQSINGSIEYYSKKGIDLIGPIMVPDYSTGINSYTGNRASIKGNGVDFVLNSTNLNGNVKWYTNFLFSYNSDKVLLYEGAVNTAAGYINGGVVKGKPLNSIFSYKWAGLDPADGNPLGYVANRVVNYTTVLSGKNTTPEDLVYHGTTTPKFFGSLRNELSYKNLLLSFLISYKFNYYFRRNSIIYANLFNDWGGHNDYILRWKKSGDQVLTNVPSFIDKVDNDRDYFYSKSEVLVQKGDHVRLQDIRLSYDFNLKWGEIKLIQKVQLYTYINNIGILWRANKYKIDPDYGDGLVPSSRSFAIGASIIF